MARSVKIHKKKSFMFTTKHHSFAGWMSLTLGIFTMGVIITSVIYSYHEAGTLERRFGMIGLCSLLLSVFGIISGSIGVKERDAYNTVPIIGICINSIVEFSILIMTFLSFFGGAN